MSLLHEGFEVHDTLNPKLWDINSQLMLPEVRQKLIDIVSAFEDYIDVPIHIVDAQVCGSNASYNYTSNSDLDLHVIANFDLMDVPEGLLQQLYNAKKSSFNRETDITIHGIQVEIYVQDIKSQVNSNGIYSICDNDWVKEPKPIKSITKHNTEKEFEKWSDHIQQVLAENDYNAIVDTVNMLYLMRTNSLAVDGEYSKGNQLFKEIRNAGYLKELKDAMLSCLSRQLTLEGCTAGVIVNRIDESYFSTRKFVDCCK